MKTILTAAALVLASSTAVAGWDMPFFGDSDGANNSNWTGNGTANGAGNGQGSADGSFDFAMSFKGTGRSDMKADYKGDMAANTQGANDFRGRGHGYSYDQPYYRYAPVAPQAPQEPTQAK